MTGKPGVTTCGTAKELAAHGVGFSASGTSEYSRHAAHAGNIKLNGWIEDKPPNWARPDSEKTRRHRKPHPRELGLKIAEQASLLSALHMRLRTERDEKRRDKVRKNIEIKTRFLEQLKQEQREALGQTT